MDSFVEYRQIFGEIQGGFKLQGDLPFGDGIGGFDKAAAIRNCL